MRRWALLLASLVLLAGCSDDASAGELNATVVPDRPFVLGSESLTDTSGADYTLATDTDKRLTLVFFGFTQCPDICPITMQTIASAMTRLSDEDREEVGMAFVSTDPTTDTPQVLRRYLDRLDPTFVGLTGDLDEIVALGKSVGVFVADGQQLASGGYDLGSHGSQVLALDAEGEVPAYWGQDTSAAEYASDIHTMLGED